MFDTQHRTTSHVCIVPMTLGHMICSVRIVQMWARTLTFNSIDCVSFSPNHVLMPTVRMVHEGDNASKVTHELFRPHASAYPGRQLRSAGLQSVWAPACQDQIPGGQGRCY